MYLLNLMCACQFSMVIVSCKTCFLNRGLSKGGVVHWSKDGRGVFLLVRKTPQLKFQGPDAGFRYVK